MALAGAVDAEVRQGAVAALAALEDKAVYGYKQYTQAATEGKIEPNAIAFLQTAHNASVSNTPLDPSQASLHHM